MEIEIILEKFGLNKNEAKIYAALLELGISTASEISKKTGLHRTYFYDIAKELVQKGTIKQLKKGKKTYFSAEAPDNLLKTEESRLEELRKNIPRLNAMNNLKGQKPKVYFYEGKKGLEEINDETLREKGELAGFTTPRFISAGEKRFSEEYIRRRKSIGKKARVIGEMSNEILEIKRRDKDELRQTRILPKDLFNSEIEIIIDNNKVYIINYKDEFGMVIEDREIAKVQKQIFEIVWNSGRIIE